MNAINSAISALNKGIDTSVDYLKENGVVILGLLAVIYYVRNNTNLFKGASARGHVLASSASTASSTSTTATSNTATATATKMTNPRNLTRNEQMRQVRLRQQELGDQRAKEAAKERKEKMLREKERKNHVAKEKQKAGGNKLGDGGGSGSGSGSGGTGSTSSGDACAYTPMQPWSSNSTGYRPARRTTRRG